jgi:hypothetical protein
MLAAAVLARREVVLATQVLSAGEHVLDRGIELAAVVMRSALEAEGERASGWASQQ